MSNINQTIKMTALTNWSNLSPTEFTYLQLLSTLGTSKEVGSIFGKSRRTIEKMTSNLCKKLKIYNKLELQLFAKFLTSYIDIPYEYLRYPSISPSELLNRYTFDGI
jgi:DNA-binding CsgD family transcriptional regulator